jgi:glucose/arabinose dehydrogenase
LILDSGTMNLLYRYEGKAVPVGKTGLPSRLPIFLCGTLFLALAFSACNGGDDSGTTPSHSLPPPPSSIGVRLQSVTTGLSAPVFMAAPPADNTRLFIVERGGRIKVFDVSQGAVLSPPFLDLSAAVTSGGERGLLGMAFDPGYQMNGRFYVYYTDTNGDIAIAGYMRSANNPNEADPAEVSLLQSIPHPTFSNHNGGMLAFGPDGCLYAGVGDGGGSGDPNNNAQNTASRLGKLLRLDPNSGSPCTNVITNPFAFGGGAPEIWSLGLRNPWRFSFDRRTGDLYIGDVGEASREEVNVALSPNAGRQLNYGWSVMEGFLCFNPPGGCNSTGLTLPVLDYPHSDGACSIIGGYVYRGTAIPALNGTYFYADLCAGFVRSFRLLNAEVTDQFEWSNLSPGASITSFGEDAQGELYIMTLGGGLWRFSPL